MNIMEIRLCMSPLLLLPRAKNDLLRQSLSHSVPEVTSEDFLLKQSKHPPPAGICAAHEFQNVPQKTEIKHIALLQRRAANRELDCRVTL